MADSQENTYRLYCVLKDNPHASFSVKIPPSATVEDVKLAIVPGAKPLTLLTITLYSTKLPDDSSLKENVGIAMSKNPAPLRSSTRLDQIWSSTPPEQMVHIIVELPSESMSRDSSGSSRLSGKSTQQQEAPGNHPASSPPILSIPEQGDVIESRSLLEEASQRASAIHLKAWGKQWPQSEDIIYKHEICDDIASLGDDDDNNMDMDDDDMMDDDSNNNDNDNDNDKNDDEIYGLADKLAIPDQFNYQFFKGIRELKVSLGVECDDILDDIVVIRDEYKALRMALEVNLVFKRCIVVTGHPGIGKSTFLLYLLLYRLENKLPTAIQFNAEEYIIFDEQGGKVNSTSYRDPRLEKCWALSDSNDTNSQPCLPFKKLAKRVILTSSPRPERWKEWIKQRMGRLIISDLPSVTEIAAVVKERNKLMKHLEGRVLYDLSSTLSLVRKWGPSTRNVIRSMESAALFEGVDPIEGEAGAAAIYICMNPSAIFVGSNRTPHSQGSSLLFLRRTPNANVASDQGQTFIPTKHLHAIFETWCGKKTNEEILDLISLLSSHSFTKSAAGWGHEQAMHKRLVQGNKALEIFQGSTKELMQPSSRLLNGSLDGLKLVGVNDSFYWVPSTGNFPGIDSVLGDKDGNIYTIQATTAENHKGPQDGIKKVWRQLSSHAQTKRTWHYVVIARTERAARMYVEKFSKELHGFKLGKAGVQVKVWAGVLDS